jgi:DNA-binding transcriptional ArsR family regulator
MKRDMDLIREILYEIEKSQKFTSWIDIEIEEYSQEEIEYHVALLNDAGLILAIPPKSRGFGWKPKRLTWEGHEFLEAARDDKRWMKAKDIMETTGGFVYEIVKPLLIELAKESLKPYLT